MKKTLTLLVMITMMLSAGSLTAQSSLQKIGLGLNAGGRLVYGDRPEESIGVGGGGFISYRILPFADLALGIGYNQLKFNFVPGTSGSTTDMLNFDLQTNIEIISKGLFRPYISLGGGLVSATLRNSGVSAKTAASYFGGGGFKLHLSPAFDLFLGADYRFTGTDRLDNLIDEGTAKDGYMNFNTGFVYTLGGGREEQQPNIIAEERMPFYEVGEEPQYFDNPADSRSGAYGAGVDSKDMQEYVKLKSKVDQLSGDISVADEEIVELQQRLSERKRMLASLETEAARKPTKRMASNSSMSGFSEIYEQALIHYYNKEYTEAMSLFRLLLQQYSNHALASSCQFWLGQSLFALNRFGDAIDEFYKVLSFERSSKKDDALFLLGKSYLKTGSGDRAKESFSRLMSDHPNSEYVQEARSYLARL